MTFLKEVGHELSRQCEGCHSAAMVTGEIKGPGLKGLSPMASGNIDEKGRAQKDYF